MSACNKLAVFASALTLISAPMLASAAEARTRTHHRHFANGHNPSERGCPVHEIADGSLVDCHGWRKWSGAIGWDNTCFRTLDYLPSQFACSGRGRN
jgi:hypothetical protein